MSKLGRIRFTRLVFLLCAAMAAGSAFFTPSVAAASPLEGVLAPVGETVRTATSTVNQIAPTTTSTPPVASPPQVPPSDPQALPDVTAATSRVLSEAAKLRNAGDKLPLPAVRLPAPSGQPPVSLGNGSGGSPTGPVARTVETATQTAATTVEALGETVESTQSSVVDRATGTVATVTGHPAAPPPAASSDPEAPAPTDEASVYVGGGFLPSPSEDGSVRAPLGKWAAYIWPAVALTGSAFPGFKDWAKDALRQALDPGSATAGPGPEQGIAGAHAEHLGGGSSGSSLFSQIPSALTGGYGPEIPFPVMVFYLAVVIAIFGVLVAMLWDLEYLGRSRRRW